MNVRSESAPSGLPPSGATAYYSIDEELARRAKESYSFSAYEAGSATASYRAQVDAMVEFAARCKQGTQAIHHAKIDRYVDLYARKLAANINRGHAIDARCPSVMIAGPANFPTRKKEQQNAARSKNFAELKEIEAIKAKIGAIGTGGISADDPQALDKLRQKLADLQAAHEAMKQANAWYRQHGTLDGCPHLSAELLAKTQYSMAAAQRHNPACRPVPFAAYSLSNDTANIKQVQERIASLERRDALCGWKFAGGEVIANQAENRLQLIFEAKPPEQQRNILKRHGFRWAPSQGAWQRQLTANAMFACKQIAFVQPNNLGKD
jgi:hypothetical protein